MKARDILKSMFRDDFQAAHTFKEPEWWRQVLRPNVGYGGTAVTEDTAMQIAAVSACVRILSETVSSLPLVVYERGENGSRREAVDHPLYSLLKFGPNKHQTPQQYLEQTMVGLTLAGNAYSQIVRDNGNRIMQIVPMQPQLVGIQQDTGKLSFVYKQPQGESRTFSRSQVWRVNGITRDGLTGISPIQLLKQPAAIAQDADMAAGKMLANGLMPSAVFELDGKIAEDDYEKVKERLKEFQGSKNAADVLILQSGMKMNGVSMSPQDAQLLLSRKFQIAEIARVFRVPLHMLNELDKATFSNIEHQSLEFVMHTIRPWCTRIEQTVTRDLIGPAGAKKYFAEFKLDALLRGDLKSRYEAYAVAVTNGWMNRNEVRRKENLNPAEGLDEFLTPLNMATEDERNSDI